MRLMAVYANVQAFVPKIDIRGEPGPEVHLLFNMELCDEALLFLWLQDCLANKSTYRASDLFQTWCN
ncbi:hypothetical protein EJB05_43136 [Eragrostis curvula]|uniref:Uncharacterized protein n=1 Tax=Eragrostis curvula TaxID=38414 RepID=A0A5J9TEA6_9POAL|nr:hypothetical protein EJB05_43136 [Eragrostis curvula]